MNKLLVKMVFVGEEERRAIDALAAGRLEPAYYSEDWTPEYYYEQLREAEVILGEPSPRALQHCEKLRMMQITWSGADRYVNAGNFPKGAVLCSMTGEYGQILSDYALGMIHALCFDFPHYVRNMERGVWNFDKYCRTLEGCTVLIVGAGDIGRSTAIKLRPSVGKIIGLRRRAGDLPEFDETTTLDRLDELLPEADIVVLSLPGTAETVGLIDERRMRLMREDAILVNVGRGSVLRVDDLAKVMAEGRFWGVGLDVTDPEPLPAEHPLWKQERLFLTPHIAGNAYRWGSGTDKRIKARALENIQKYFDGKPLDRVVDFGSGYVK